MRSTAAFPWSNADIHTTSIVFQANNLTDGLHTVNVTNLGNTAGSFFDFDYAVVNSTIDPSGSTGNSTGGSGSGSSNNVGAIAGGVVGGVVGLALVVLLAWLLLRRSARRKKDDYYYPKPVEGRMDLNGEEIKPYEHGMPSQRDPSSYTIPDMALDGTGSFHGYSTNNPRSPSAREADTSQTPFLSQVPPPTPSNTTSYPHSVDPSTSSTGDAPSVLGSSALPNSFTNGSGSTGEPTTNLPGQQRSFGTSSASGPTTGVPSIIAETKSAGVALPYTARIPEASAQLPPTASPPREDAPNRHSRVASPSASSTQRMYVPGRELDMGPVPLVEEEGEGEGDDQVLPPDYHQATQPILGQVQGRV